MKKFSFFFKVFPKMDAIPESARVQAEAHAFRALVAHLQAHPHIQNMDTMTTSGFCRNCLSKWLLAGFRQQAPLPIASPLTYEKVSEHVYGMDPKAWKKEYQIPATSGQIERYEESKVHHATHGADAVADAGASPPVSLDPCCPDPTTAVPAVGVPPAVIGASPARCPVLPTLPPMVLSVGVLTVSDRASRGEYPDKSGPLVQQCLREWADVQPQLSLTIARERCSPDCKPTIEATLREWSSLPECNMIVTTGGTGFGPRDVTPEATLAVLEKVIPSISMAIASETSLAEPLSFLSRGIVGVANSTVVVNVPGSPSAVLQHLRAGLPMLVHAVAALQRERDPLSGTASFSGGSI